MKVATASCCRGWAGFKPSPYGERGVELLLGHVSAGEACGQARWTGVGDLGFWNDRRPRPIIFEARRAFPRSIT